MTTVFQRALTAVSENDHEALQIALKEDPNIVLIKHKTWGTTLLHLALSNGSMENVRLILMNGADPDLEDTVGFRPLHHAINSGQPEVVSMFLKANADVNAPSSAPIVQMLFGALKDEKRQMDEQTAVAILKDLIDHGLELNQVHHKFGCPLHSAATTEYVDFAECLLSNGADIDARNQKKETPLHISAQEGTSTMIELLLKNGAEKDARNHFNETPLHVAAKVGKRNAAELLLDNGADPEGKKDYGLTPLHEATLCSQRELVCTLIERGAWVNNQTDSKFERNGKKIAANATALALAEVFGQKEIAQDLEAAGGIVPPRGVFAKWKRLRQQV